MFSEIAEIKFIRKEKSRLSAREKELTKPRLTNLDMLEQLYAWFKEILAGRDCAPRIESVTQRKKFLFIVLYLYSPSSLAGGKMAKGVRRRISKVLGIGAPSAVSDNVSSVVFFYDHYPEFHQDVEWIYTEITKRMERKTAELLSTCLQGKNH